MISFILFCLPTCHSLCVLYWSDKFLERTFHDNKRIIGETELTYHILNNGQYLRVIRDAILVQHYRVEVYSANDGKWELKAKVHF